MSQEKKTITIASKLYDKIKIKLQNPQIGFNSVDEYVDYILKNVLDENKSDPDIVEKISKEETERIQNELKKLGYI